MGRSHDIRSCEHFNVHNSKHPDEVYHSEVFQLDRSWTFFQLRSVGRDGRHFLSPPRATFAGSSKETLSWSSESRLKGLVERDNVSHAPFKFVFPSLILLDDPVDHRHGPITSWKFNSAFQTSHDRLWNIWKVGSYCNEFLIA